MSDKLKIIHCLRAPVGGLFRHVCDLVEDQASSGHLLGIVCDNSFSDLASEIKLKQLEKVCRLGVHRLTMKRGPAFSDFSNARYIENLAAKHRVDILHGHGAKGGAYARLLKKPTEDKVSKRVYTPHGGSLHYSESTLKGYIFHRLERFLSHKNDAVIFESKFSRDRYFDVIGKPNCPCPVIYNGIDETEFKTIELQPNPADFIFVGELRELKGIGTLLNAFEAIKAEYPSSRLLIAGEGPDRDKFNKLSKTLGLEKNVEFLGYKPAREVFTLGRLLLVPSWNESFPYIVLEACAAGKSMVATNVGGIPEIMGDMAKDLIEPQNAEQLSQKMQQFLLQPEKFQNQANQLQDRVRLLFSNKTMFQEIINLYKN